MSVIVAPDQRRFEMHRDLIEVTSVHRPDETWAFTDTAGHVHRWEWPDGQRVYRPDQHPMLPSLTWIIDGYEYFEDSEDPHPVGHYECVICAAHIAPGFTADSNTQYIPGLAHYYIDGHAVSEDVFKREFERSTGHAL